MNENFERCIQQLQQDEYEQMQDYVDYLPLDYINRTALEIDPRFIPEDRVYKFEVERIRNEDISEKIEQARRLGWTFVLRQDNPALFAARNDERVKESFDDRYRVGGQVLMQICKQRYRMIKKSYLQKQLSNLNSINQLGDQTSGMHVFDPDQPYIGKVPLAPYTNPTPTQYRNNEYSNPQQRFQRSFY